MQARKWARKEKTVTTRNTANLNRLHQPKARSNGS